MVVPWHGEGEKRSEETGQRDGSQYLTDEVQLPDVRKTLHPVRHTVTYATEMKWTKNSINISIQFNVLLTTVLTVTTNSWKIGLSN